MEYMDVRIRMPVHKLGSFVLLLPDWAQMIGYDKLKSSPSLQSEDKPQKSRKPNGNYVPKQGSTVEAVLKYITDKSPTQRNELLQALGKEHAVQALSSAISQLRDR